uniref:Uncharacterized protein n=1 Tax=Aegilops tauschii subsp. strangulata TaxID=200361 RepID=A0A453KAM6_AEGTS
ARSRSRPPPPAAPRPVPHRRPPVSPSSTSSPLSSTSSPLLGSAHTGNCCSASPAIKQQPRPGSQPPRGVVSPFPAVICHRRRRDPALRATAVEDSDRVGRFVQRSSPSPSATKLLGASVHHLQI